MFRRYFAVLGGLGLLAVAATAAQLPPPAFDPLIGARSLALSPDGTRLAFSYRGDIWVAPSSGGRAIPITNHVEMDDGPIWSPDGQWIAFNSNRNGSTDMYVVPADGGASQRLTWFPGADTATDWTPDGRYLVLRGVREKVENALYLLDVNTTDLIELTVDNRTIQQPRVSPDGTKLVYFRYGFPWTRPRYSGSSAAQLWVMDMESRQTQQLRSTEFQHLWADFGPDGSIYCVTTTEVTPSSHKIGSEPTRYTDNPERTPNVTRVDMDGDAERLTDFVGGSGARYLTVANETGMLAFERDGTVYTMVPGQDPQAISLTATVDDKVTLEERLVLTTGASEGVLSPDGKHFAFVVENEIWTVPVEQGRGPNASDATQVTAWAGIDRNVLWHPESKSIFFTSDRDGAERLYRFDLESKETTRLTDPDFDVLEVRLTPDKKFVSFWMSGEEGGLYRIPVEGGSPEQVIDYPRQFRWEADTSYDWSPDSRYVAYAKAAPGTNVNIWLHDTQTGVETNVTRLAANHGSPHFSLDGRYLYFVGQRGNEEGLFVVPLVREDARGTDTERKYSEPKETPQVEIEVDRIDERIRLFVNQPAQGNIRPDRKTGDVYWWQSGQIWRANYTGEDARAITSAGFVSQFEWTADGDNLAVVCDGNLQKINIRRPDLPTSTTAFRIDWIRDLRLVRQAAFSQFWREYNRGFYDPNFHGRDWAEIRSRYEPLLSSVGHRNEFATILNMMVGELDASHAEVGPAGGNPSSPSFGHPGLTFDYSYYGPAIRVLAVPERTPGSYEKTKIEPGDYIVAINGKDVRLNEALWRDVLIGQNDRDLTLLVNDSPSRAGAREVKFRALSGGEWGGINYSNRIEGRRRYVEAQTNGELTYIHISGMGQANLQRFNLEVWEFMQGKKGVIIDVRDNGGGNISDSLVDLIERRPNYFYYLRDASPSPQPDFSWTLPSVVLHSQTSLSNAEMFPYSMQQRGFATLIGMPTPGYVIGTYSLPLVDGTSARMPTWGVYRLDGTPMENLGQRPDIEIEWYAEQWKRGEDPQLDRAIQELLKKVSN